MSNRNDGSFKRRERANKLANLSRPLSDLFPVNELNKVKARAVDLISSEGISIAPYLPQFDEKCIDIGQNHLLVDDFCVLMTT